MHAWDLDGADPAAVADELRALGLDACSLAFGYHGGRMVLPRGRRGRVRELDPGAVYFASDPSRYQGLRLRPRVAPEASLVPPFVRACAGAGIAVGAWVVVCHNDRLGAAHPECCVENVYGDRYPYALCPSHPEVRRYAAALCADVAATPGVARLELEALGFMGVEHASLHDKCGVPLGAAATWLLSVCACQWCRVRVGAPLDAFAPRARLWLDDHFAAPAPGAGRPVREALDAIVGAPLLDALLDGRRQVVATLLDEVRAAAGPLHLDVRLATDPLFVGGKAALGWADLAGRADSATVSFFGAPLERMRGELRALPPAAERGVPVFGAFAFHAPDCASEADVRQRLALLRTAGVDGVSAYCLGLAAAPQLAWLAAALADDAAGADTAAAAAPTPSPSEIHA
jgi:hypothetical protein